VAHTDLDLLRGSLDVIVLRTLAGGPAHGLAIARWIRAVTDDALQLDEGSLYPALYRMERDGWIESDWGTSELGRKAKFYHITEKGRRQLRAETKEFASFVAAVAPLLLPT